VQKTGQGDGVSEPAQSGNTGKAKRDRIIKLLNNNYKKEK